MRFTRLAAILGSVILLLSMASSIWKEKIQLREDLDYLKNVSVSGDAFSLPESLQPVMMPASEETPVPSKGPEYAAGIEQSDEKQQASIPAKQEPIRETSITGGMQIKNATQYDINVTEFLSLGPGLTLQPDTAQILIMHTHGSEAFTPAGMDRYEESDYRRTEDTQYNVIRVGEELKLKLEEYGLQVIHDQRIHDSPSYTGSYTRSGEAVEEVLKNNPGIDVVIDLHRDALDANGVIYKTMAEEDGVCASQLMLLVGSDASGLSHPDWQKNLALALYLQRAAYEKHPSLMRPVSLVQQRYNQHLSPGSLILEVGSSGNTLQEALAAIRLFGEAAGPALAGLVEPSAAEE